MRCRLHEEDGLIPLSLRRASVRDLDIATKVAESAEWTKNPNRKDAILPSLDGLSCHHRQCRLATLLSRWPGFVIAHVDAALKVAEEVSQEWMLDGQLAQVGNEVFGGGIGAR